MRASILALLAPTLASLAASATLSAHTQHAGRALSPRLDHATSTAHLPTHEAVKATSLLPRHHIDLTRVLTWSSAVVHHFRLAFKSNLDLRVVLKPAGEQASISASATLVSRIAAFAPQAQGVLHRIPVFAPKAVVRLVSLASQRRRILPTSIFVYAIATLIVAPAEAKTVRDDPPEAPIVRDAPSPPSPADLKYDEGEWSWCRKDIISKIKNYYDDCWNMNCKVLIHGPYLKRDDIPKMFVDEMYKDGQYGFRSRHYLSFWKHYWTPHVDDNGNIVEPRVRYDYYISFRYSRAKKTTFDSSGTMVGTTRSYNYDIDCKDTGHVKCCGG